MASRTVRSTDGLFSLEVPADWRWEPPGEDAPFAFHDPAGSGVVCVFESLRSDGAPPALPDGEPCLVNGFAARRAVLREPSRRVRRWVIEDGRTVLNVSHEGPPGDDADEDARVDAFLGTVRLHDAPHPTIGRLLRGLSEAAGVTGAWRWNPSRPLSIESSERPWEVGLERLVRAVDVAPETLEMRVAHEVRRIRNLGLFEDGGPALALVRDSILPIVRTGVVAEAVEGPARASYSSSAYRPRLVCGERLLRRLFAPGLFVYYAVDVPGAFHFVTPSMCAEWGVSMAEVETVAVQNLGNALERDRFDVARTSNGALLVLEDGEGLAASRLLRASTRTRISASLGEAWRMVVPNAGTLIAFSAGFTDWLTFLGEDVWEAYLQQPMPLTPQVFAHQGGDLFVPVGSA